MGILGRGVGRNLFLGQDFRGLPFLLCIFYAVLISYSRNGLILGRF